MKLMIFGLLVLFLVACTGPTASVKEPASTGQRTGFSGGASPNRHHQGKTPERTFDDFSARIEIRQGDDAEIRANRASATWNSAEGMYFLFGLDSNEVLMISD